MISVMSDIKIGGETRRSIENSDGGDRRTGDGLAPESGAAVTECLVVSGALDRTLCIFRARFGQGLCLLRRLNVACSPRGLPGALIVGVPVEGANGDVEGNQLEVHERLVVFVGTTGLVGCRKTIVPKDCHLEMVGLCECCVRGLKPPRSLSEGGVRERSESMSMKQPQHTKVTTATNREVASV